MYQETTEHKGLKSTDPSNNVMRPNKTNGKNNLVTNTTTLTKNKSTMDRSHEAIETESSPQKISYFIPDPSNPDNLLGPMTQDDLDLFQESRKKLDDIIDKVIFDPAAGLYYMLQNKCHTPRIAAPLAIYHSRTRTTYCYDDKLQQFIFVYPSLCPPNTMFVIYNESDIPHCINNMIGIPYPPVPSLAQAEDIPPLTEQSGALFRDSLDPFTQPIQDITSSVDERWDNPSFVMFNTDQDNADRTPNSKLTPTDSINLNPTKPTKTTQDNSDRNKIQKNTIKNLLHQLDEQHPRFQDLVATNRHLINNAKKYASSNNGKLNNMTS